MAEGVDVAERFNRALDSADPRRLLAVLDPAFRAEVTAGLPEGWGGTFAHVLRIREERVAELIQVTDSWRWHEALERTGGS